MLSGSPHPVSLILYGVDAPWMTPLYIAEILMFFILGAECSDYSKSNSPFTSCFSGSPVR